MANPPASVSRQPMAPWLGRLILPEEARSREDAAQFEVRHAAADYADLVGQVVRLQWAENATRAGYVDAVRQDIQFTEMAMASVAEGNVHPLRLNNRAAVGPLESLAGAREENTITVMLRDPVEVSTAGGQTTLRISEEPIQITGEVYSVVTLRRRLHPEQDRFEVQHYTPATQAFDGPLEVVRIPQAAADGFGIRRSTNQNIEASPANPGGWYIYGLEDPEGMFEVQAIEPFQALALQPDRVILGEPAGCQYIERDNWRNTRHQPGTLKTVLVDPAAADEKTALERWQEGDTLLLIHLFGGVGGDIRDEELFPGLVMGHFAYGTGQVVRDPLTQALRFDVEYHQVYAHNVGGIISGTFKRQCYLGDLQRGWLGARPVSDILVKLDAVTQDYHFGSFTLSPFTEFVKQLTVMAARYRIGDGTGAAIVSTARCCVQDSNQALYVALERVEDEVRHRPEIQAWLEAHPDDPETIRFRKLQALGQALNRKLVPLGIVRRDWYRNAEDIAGVEKSSSLPLKLLRTLASWRTMLPRRAHDEVAKILLDHGAQLWFIRTNQVGGENPDVIPYAPTTLLGGILRDD